MDRFVCAAFDDTRMQEEWQHLEAIVSSTKREMHDRDHSEFPVTSFIRELIHSLALACQNISQERCKSPGL
jgi:hypothetical protein